MKRTPTNFYLCSSLRPQVGVPRRFGIGTMILLTVVFALLFGVLNRHDVLPAPFAYILILVAEVAACQVLLFKGNDPRAASIVGGSVITYLMSVVVCLTTDFGPRDFTREMTFSFLGISLLLFIGAFLGYLVGSLITAIFWLYKKIAGILSARCDRNGRVPEEHEER